MTTKHTDAFSPDQERDENGRWVSTGSGDNASEIKKAAGGGIHELKRTERGTIAATHSKGGRTSHMGEYSTPEKAKAAIAEHETKVKERLRTTGANSAKVHNQVTEGIHANREARNALMGSSQGNRWSGGAASEAAGARSEGAHSAAQLKHSAQAKEARGAGRKAEAEAHATAAMAHAGAAASISNKGSDVREKGAAARQASIKALEASRVAARASPGAEPGQQFARPGEHMGTNAKTGKPQSFSIPASEQATSRAEERYVPSAGRDQQIVKERQALANKQGFADFNGGRGVGRAPPTKTTGPSGKTIGKQVERLPSGKYRVIN